jgi:transketolase
MRLGRMVGAKVAHIHIHRYPGLLGPGVHAQVRFGQQHGGGDAAGAVVGNGQRHPRPCNGRRAGKPTPATLARPMGMADMAVALWGAGDGVPAGHLKHNPRNPNWFDRDRFVLSNGHASMLMYALLHLTGYKLPMAELKNFRQLHSKTAGHPEHGVTPGVETTTGPLGQGIANAVGMALAEKLLASEFNREGHAVVDHHTYVFMGDGCLMEGISHEAAALAGAWKLNKLVALYDDNGISIDGQVAPWFIDNTALRFVAYGWNVLGPIDGHDAAAGVRGHCRGPEFHRAAHPDHLQDPHRQGQPEPRQHRQGPRRAAGRRRNQADPRGAGLDRRALRDPQGRLRRLGCQGRRCRGRAGLERAVCRLQGRAPDAGPRIVRRMKGDLPKNFDQTAVDTVLAAHTKAETVASRKASQLALEAFTAALPEMLGGSADLTGSNLTNTKSHAEPAL